MKKHVNREKDANQQSTRRSTTSSEFSPLQRMADNSPQLQQAAQLQTIADNSPQVKQAAQLQAAADDHAAQSTKEQPVQRMIKLNIDEESFVGTVQDGKRPQGLAGHQGDHSTPYKVLQDQVNNAIAGTTLDDAWSNLMSTFSIYQSLPGWELSTKHIKKNSADYVLGLLTKKGDINALQVAVEAMLTLRNQVALTSFPNGGHGNAEGKWAGSLQHQERQFQLGHIPALQQGEIIDYMWKAFEHGRLNAMKSDEKKQKVLKQHAMTIYDAYPQLSAHYKINADTLMANYTKRDWATWKG